MSALSAYELLRLGWNEFELKLRAQLVCHVNRDFIAWRKQRRREAKARVRSVPRRQRQWFRAEVDDQAAGRRQRRGAETRQLFDYLAAAIVAEFDQIEQLELLHAEFRKSYRVVPSPAEGRRLILDFAAELGASKLQLYGDKWALRRWFGADAVEDRYTRQKGEREQTVAFLLDRLGVVAERILRLVEPAESVATAWQRLDLERIVKTALVYDGNPLIRLAGLKCLATAARGLPARKVPRIVSKSMVLFVQRTAVDRQAHIWLQREALQLVPVLAPSALTEVIGNRLRQPGSGDDMFVRRFAVRLMGDHFAGHPTLIPLLGSAAADPAAFVRQQSAETAWRAPTDAAIYWLHHLAREDPSPQVRATVLVAAAPRVARGDLRLPFLRLLRKVLALEQEPFVLRVALHTAVVWLDACRNMPRAEPDHDLPAGTAPAGVADYYRAEILPAMRQLQSAADFTPVRRWAAAASEQVWVRLDATACKLLTELRPVLDNLPPGATRRIGRRLRGFSLAVVGRVLAVIAQDDYDCNLTPTRWGYRLTRGPVFKLRFWRLLHELLHPSTDKRQAHRHTVGRVSDATIRAPSAIMAELSQTKVPGEPLHDSDEAGWRPYLPLVDDVLSAMDQGLLAARPVRFFTSEGVTDLVPPRWFFRRMLASLVLTIRFAHYARLRNGSGQGQAADDAYVGALARLGVRVTFRPHADQQGRPVAHDRTVLQFFPMVLALLQPGLLEAAQRQFLRFGHYFSSVFENSLPQLLLFAGLVLALFVTRHLHANATFRLARRRIPLCIGGWGTRGKSGTERLKAALFSALGYGVVSKSTGCEALFLQSYASGPLRELPLYRPYDKATIWEHRNLMLLAARMSPAVFLWECMGLTPSYVDVLQRQWSADDLATITNTYPDHEDLQGPSGLDVAEVIAGFIPVRSHLITTERQMLPVLRSKCRRVGTRMRRVDWLSPGLLTDDVLDRFPYKEHPENIALVLALADEIRCDRDFALKEMADRLVPDLGVLRTFPTAILHCRRLAFTNGMSANERFGCLGNWSRMEFDRHDPAAEPGVWITTVVNNRADRVPRSRVFADLLVRDISADCHFLIGTNLEGMQGFLRQARDQYARELTVWRRDDSAEQAVAAFRQLALRLRQAIDASQIRAELAVMLDGIATALADGLTADARHELEDLWQQPAALADRLAQLRLDPDLTASLKTHLDRQLRAGDEYQRMAARIESAAAAERDEVNAAVRAVLRKWLARKIVVLESGDLPGEQIIARICAETPPGFFNRIMGMQNIKGAGLDLVHRWQAWRQCHEACRMLLDADRATARRGLQTLAAFQEFGQLCEHEVGETIRRARVLPAAQREDFQAELDVVQTRLDLALQEIAETRPGGARTKGVAAKLRHVINDFRDLTAAVRRRRKADLIYRDLCNQRISQEHAALELRALGKGAEKTELPSFFSLRRYLSARKPALRSAPVDLPGKTVAEQPVAGKS